MYILLMVCFFQVLYIDNVISTVHPKSYYGNVYPNCINLVCCSFFFLQIASQLRENLGYPINMAVVKVHSYIYYDD